MQQLFGCGCGNVAADPAEHPRCRSHNVSDLTLCFHLEAVE